MFWALNVPPGYSPGTCLDFLEEILLLWYVLLKAVLCFVIIVVITTDIGFLPSPSCVSSVSYVDEPSQHDAASHLTVQMENTYQLGVL